MAFRNPIVQGTSVSGFIFANRDEGTKVVDIDLIGHRKTKFFTFSVSIPGIKADHHEVDFDSLYSEDEIVHLNEKQLRSKLEDLPCCATNEEGTENGDPLNLILIGTREELISAFIRRGWLSAPPGNLSAALSRNSVSTGYLLCIPLKPAVSRY